MLGELPHDSEPDYIPAYANHPEVEEYHRQLHDDRVRNLGGKPRVTMSVGTVFPNMSFHGRQPRTLLIAHPVGPNETELWRFYLVDADAPAAVKDVARRYYLRYSGPGGMTEADDMENWSHASAATQGAIARRRKFNYQLGLNRVRPAPGLTGAVESGSCSEENARIFYRRWAALMSLPPQGGVKE